MARNDPDSTVTLSLLDRLIDSKPKVRDEPLMSRAKSVGLLKESLKRDLEWLLNTRRNPGEVTDKESELYKSLFNFGLPDLTNFALNSTDEQSRLAWMLEETIAIFEPRLEGVKVAMQPVTQGSRQLRFQIEGLLRMDPAPERVSFDTVLELNSGAYQVKGESGAR